eukprot:scaffold241397_cov31-Tisochrysis_lutea.AAC.2
MHGEFQEWPGEYTSGLNPGALISPTGISAQGGRYPGIMTSGKLAVVMRTSSCQDASATSGSTCDIKVM